MLLLNLAARNLTRRRVRTLLTVLGVALAISFTVGILSISEGFMASFENSMAKQGADIIIVLKEAEAYPYPDVAAFVGSFPEALIEEIEQVDNVKAVYPVFTAIPMTALQDKPGAIPILNGVTRDYAEYSAAIVLVTHDAQVAQAATTTLRMIDGQLQ